MQKMTVKHTKPQGKDRILVLILAVVLTSMIACQEGADETSGTMDVFTSAPCTSDDSECSGYMNDTIRAAEGREGGPCTTNGTCKEGLVCNTQGICQPPVSPSCGNGVLEDGELCDDGNQIDQDGCNMRCQPDTPPNTQLPGDEPLRTNQNTGQEEIPVAFAECNDETTTDEFAPESVQTISLCVFSYQDSVGNGFDRSDVEADVSAAQAYYTSAGTNIEFDLIHTDIVEGTPQQVNPNTNAEITQILADLRADAEELYPGQCDIVAGYSNSLTKGLDQNGNPIQIGGRGTWPSAGLHTCINKVDNGPAGQTLAHELGHVLGLFHTHQNNGEGLSIKPDEVLCGCSATGPIHHP